MNGIRPLHQLMQRSHQSKGIVTANTYRSNNPQQIEWQWLPEGVWNIDGKLDPSFQDWLANKWVVKYNCDIHEARANVKSYFRNDPVKLPIKWEQYQAEFLAKVENIKTRIFNGCQISEQQQQDTINCLSALKPLNSEQSVSANCRDNLPILPINTVEPFNLTPNQTQLNELEILSLIPNQTQEKVNGKSIDDKDKIYFHRPSLSQVDDSESLNNNQPVSEEITVMDEWGNSAQYKTFTAVDKDLPPVNPEALSRLADFMQNFARRAHE